MKKVGLNCLLKIMFSVVVCLFFVFFFCYGIKSCFVFFGFFGFDFGFFEMVGFVLFLFFSLVEILVIFFR